MPSLQYFNMSKHPAAFPGVAGTLASGTTRTAVVDEFEMDSVMESLQLRGPDRGLFVNDIRFNAEIYIWANGGGNFLTTNGSLPLTGVTTHRGVAIVSGSAYVVTLPAASTYMPGTYLRVMIAGTATGGFVRRGGADTINGGAGDFALTPSAPLAIFESNGVSAWTTV